MPACGCDMQIRTDNSVTELEAWSKRSLEHTQHVGVVKDGRGCLHIPKERMVLLSLEHRLHHSNSSMTYHHARFAYTVRWSLA